MQETVPAPRGPAKYQRVSIETPTERHLRQIRNILAWMLVLWLLGIAGGVITAIAVAHHGSQPAASCLSQGGTDPGC